MALANTICCKQTSNRSNLKAPARLACMCVWKRLSGVRAIMRTYACASMKAWTLQ